MCFINENRYYIQHNFYAGMKGLSEEEKLKYYSSIKSEVRQRLKKSLHTCIDKSKFYQEAFELLSVFEADYLILNLFYENDSITIINYLHHLKLLHNLNFKDLNSISSTYFLHITSILKRDETYKESDEIYFLKSHFLNFVPSITHNDWNNENEVDNSVTSKFSKWILINLAEGANIENTFRAFFIFTKMWNYFEIISKAFNRKAILFYSTCISEYEKITESQVLVSIYKNFSKLRSMFSPLFVSIKYIPLFDIKDSEVYKQGYLIKRQEFHLKLKDLEKLASVLEITSIQSLFNSVRASENEIYFESAKNILKKKIDNYELPTNEELCKIKSLDLKGNAEELRKYLCERLYLFEWYD